MEKNDPLFTLSFHSCSFSQKKASRKPADDIAEADFFSRDRENPPPAVKNSSRSSS